MSTMGIPTIWQAMKHTLQHLLFNLYLSMGKFSRRQIDDNFLISPRKQARYFMQIVSYQTSRKRTYIILTPLNTTFI